MKSVLLVTFVFGSLLIISTYACNNCQLTKLDVKPLRKDNVINIYIKPGSTNITKECRFSISKKSYFEILEDGLKFLSLHVKCNKGPLLKVDKIITGCADYNKTKEENENFQSVLEALHLTNFNCDYPAKGKYPGAPLDATKWKDKMKSYVNGEAKCEEITFTFEHNKFAKFTSAIEVKGCGTAGK